MSNLQGIDNNLESMDEIYLEEYVNDEARTNDNEYDSDSSGDSDVIYVERDEEIIEVSDEESRLENILSDVAIPEELLNNLKQASKLVKSKSNMNSFTEISNQAWSLPWDVLSALFKSPNILDMKLSPLKTKKKLRKISKNISANKNLNFDKSNESNLKNSLSSNKIKKEKEDDICDRLISAICLDPNKPPEFCEISRSGRLIKKPNRLYSQSSGYTMRKRRKTTVQQQNFETNVTNDNYLNESARNRTSTDIHRMSNNDTDPFSNTDIDPLSNNAIDPLSNNDIDSLSNTDIDPVSNNQIDPLSNTDIDTLSNNDIYNLSNIDISHLSNKNISILSNDDNSLLSNSDFEISPSNSSATNHRTNDIDSLSNNFANSPTDSDSFNDRSGIFKDENLRNFDGSIISSSEGRYSFDVDVELLSSDESNSTTLSDNNLTVGPNKNKDNKKNSNSLSRNTLERIRRQKNKLLASRLLSCIYQARPDLTLQSCSSIKILSHAITTIKMLQLDIIKDDLKIRDLRLRNEKLSEKLMRNRD